MTGIERQKGVALLFALGILSLILVMGVAFLGNALISQKIAFNSQEANSAKLVARNAVDRALAHLTLFNLTQARDHATYYASDASSVFSRTNGTALTVNGTSQTAGSNAAAISHDMLSSVGNYDSKLTVEKKYGTPWYDGASSAAKWIYVHKNGVESNGYPDPLNTANPIVARYAYQVLPQTSKSRISLFGVTSGVTGIAGTTPAATNPRIPHTHRWGVDIDELVIPGLNNMFMTYWGTGENFALTPQYEFDNFINLLAGSSAPNPFQGTSEIIENRKRWLRNIFVEGKGRVAREAYTDGQNWYPRFNLGARIGDTDAWYSRFLRNDETDSVLEASGSAPKNGDEILNRLAAVPINNAIHKFDDSKIRDIDYVKQNGHSGIGLPFLRAIGDSSEKGAWESVEKWRKQIAANLNDYCDADSIPTSDVAADKWKDLVDKIDDLPKFTGNEQTPYINELAFGFKMSDGKITAETGKCDFEAKFTPEIIAELIRVYKSTPGISNTQLHGFIKSLGVTLKVTVSGTATGSYKKSVDGVETTVTVPEFNLNDLLIEGSDISYSEFKNKIFDIPFDTAPESGPYWGKNFQFTDAADVISVKASLYQKLREGSGTTDHEVSFTVNPTKIKVEISKVSFNLGNLVLTATVDGKENVGIDFVRFINPPGDSETFSVASGKAKEYTSMMDLSKDGIFHVGVMQAIDPRQNLNAVFQRNGTSVSTSLKSSDWLLSKDASLQFTADESAWKWDDFATRVTGGGVNTCSNPSAPKYADDSSMTAQNDCDTEETQDPAWLGDDPKQHISTAVIRNAPMRSPWELGFIHRGIPFQTINLKKAGGIDGEETLEDIAHQRENFASWSVESGTKYIFGDAGILDQIKMTEFNKSYGKVDMSALSVTANPTWWIAAQNEQIFNYNRYIFKALFEKIRTQTAADFLVESAGTDTVPSRPVHPQRDWYGTVIDDNPVADDFSMNNIPSVKLRSKVFNNSLMQGLFVVGNNDAAKEERIGKIVNLIEAESCSLPNVFKIVVVAQTIRDLSGNIGRVDSSSDETVLADDVSGLGRNAEFGRFDALIRTNPDSSLYFDEILSECRMLVTVEKIHYLETVGTAKVPRARLRVKQIEYLD